MGHCGLTGDSKREMTRLGTQPVPAAVNSRDAEAFVSTAVRTEAKEIGEEETGWTSGCETL